MPFWGDMLVPWRVPKIMPLPEFLGASEFVTSNPIQPNTVVLDPKNRENGWSVFGTWYFSLKDPAPVMLHEYCKMKCLNKFLYSITSLLTETGLICCHLGLGRSLIFAATPWRFHRCCFHLYVEIFEALHWILQWMPCPWRFSNTRRWNRDVWWPVSWDCPRSPRFRASGGRHEIDGGGKSVSKKPSWPEKTWNNCIWPV